MIQVGDLVRFLNEQGEGTVTRIIGDMAYVLIEDGFEIPSKINQLVCVKQNATSTKKETRVIADDSVKNYNYIERTDEFEEDPFKPIETNIDEDTELSNDIYFAFVSDSRKDIEQLELYLINDTDKCLVFCIFLKTNTEIHFLDYGSAEPNTKVFLTTIKREDLVHLNKIILQGILYSLKSDKKGQMIDKEIKIQTLYLLNQQYYRENDFFDEKAFLLAIFKGEKNYELLTEKLKQDSKPVVKEAKPEPENVELLEVDLHIEELIDDCQTLTAGEMLNIQLNHFRKKMEEAIANQRIKKVVFIHGVGNGTLKLELRRILSREYSHYDYQDASFKEYGFGATMVIVRR